MRPIITLLLTGILLLFTSFLTGQSLELGVKAGGAVYSGDLGERELLVDFEDINFAGGAYLRYRPTQRFGVRVNGNFGNLSGERDDLRLPNENNELVTINRNFRTTLTEFNLVLEYDLFYLGNPDGNFLATYVYGGPGVLSFNPEGTLDGVEFTELQPLRTEGQGTNPLAPTTPYELTRVVGVLGVGFRVRFADRFTVGVELGGRYTGTDYLDDLTDTRVNYLDVLGQENGGLAARFSNPAVQNAGAVEDGLTYRRGGDANDYYFVGGLTFGITLGEGGSRGTGCYNFR